MVLKKSLSLKRRFKKLTQKNLRKKTYAKNIACDLKLNQNFASPILESIF